jgi:hypothetical protein
MGEIIHYKVDGEPQKTTERVLTARQILVAAKLNPETQYLIQLEGHEQISYKDDPDKKIEMHDGQRFISNHIGPVPVS